MQTNDSIATECNPNSFKNKVVVSILNPQSPVPNISSILAHKPDSIIFLEIASPYERVNNNLSKNYEKIQYWAENNLQTLYGFSRGLNLKYSPKQHSIAVNISKLCVDDINIDNARIVERVKEGLNSNGDSELIFDLSSGRKEDVASIVRLSKQIDCSLWYTNANTGENVEVGGERGSFHSEKLDVVSKLWLEGFPVVEVNLKLKGKNINQFLLEKILDTITSLLSDFDLSDYKKRKEIGELARLGLKQQLAEKNLELEEITISPQNRILENPYDIIRISNSNTNDTGYIDLPGNIFSSDGKWLEQIAALVMIDGWRATNVYQGVAICDANEKERMNDFQGKISHKRNLNILSKIWAVLFYEDLITDNRFMDLTKILHEEKLKREFCSWIVRNFNSFPAEFQRQLLPICQIRDMDVLAETEDYNIFIECGLVDRRNSKSAQIDSLSSLVAQRMLSREIVVHSLIDKAAIRTDRFGYVCSIKDLRKMADLVNLEINVVEDLIDSDRSNFSNIPDDDKEIEIDNEEIQKLCLQAIEESWIYPRFGDEFKKKFGITQKEFFRVSKTSKGGAMQSLRKDSRFTIYYEENNSPPKLR